MTCQLTSIPNTLRSEGATEMVADLLIDCQGGAPTAATPGSPINTGTITVNLSVPVTSRILSSTTGASEALLLIDEPGNLPIYAGSPAGTNVGAFLPQSGVSATSALTNTYVVGAVTGGNGTAVGACPTGSLVGSSCTANLANVFQGIVPANGFQVQFQAVPILPPGTTGLHRFFRITNVRVSATSLASAPISALTGVQAFVSITTTVTSLNPSSIAVGFAQQGLAASSTVRGPANTGSLSATATAASGNQGSLGFLQCLSVPNTTPAGTTPQGGAVLRFTPSFAGAFKTRTLATVSYTGLSTNLSPGFAQNVPGGAPINYATFSESGLVFTGFSSTSGSIAGLADFGTRLKAEFVNIPAGVNVFVTTSNIVGSIALGNSVPAAATAYSLSNVVPGGNIPIALLVLSETVPDLPNFIQTPISNLSNSTGAGNLPIYQVPITNGAGVAVWEVVQEPSAATTGNNLSPLDFGVFFQYTVTTSTTFSTLPGQVGLSYAPTPPGGLVPGPLVANAATASSIALATSIQIPRFADTSTQHQFTLIQLGACQTLLLFPYVTNQAGFETGIAIANTSADGLGTTGQNGACTFTFFGTVVNQGGTPKTNTITGVAPSPIITAGGSFVDTLSHTIGSTNSFSGYMFANCNFQFAHGFAFISDASATNLAEGYLALVVTNGGTAPARGVTSLVGGETLVH